MTSFESSDGLIRVDQTEQSPILHLLSVTVAPARVDRAFDRAYSGLRKEARVKGFRPGKVPRAVLERMYRASLLDEIERALVGETLPDAVELAGLRPVVEPDIEAERPEPGKPFAYQARIEVKPAIELPETRGLPGRRPAVSVGEDEVLTHLEQLRERSAPLVEEPEGTAAAPGHFLTIDFVGRVDGEPFEGGSAKGHEVELGAGRLLPGFEEQLLGATAGQDRQVEIDFPADYGNSALAGKRAVFAVHVDAVKARRLPELDDEFAKDVGDFETLEDLRRSIRDDLRAQRDRIADAALRRSVLDSLIARTDFELPPGLVERQLQYQLSSFRREYQDRVPADLLESQLARMAEDGRAAAARRVREDILLEAVASAQAVQASDEEVDGRLDELANERGLPPGDLRKLARDQGWREAIRSELVDRKALDFLVAGAEVEEIEAGKDA